MLVVISFGFYGKNYKMSECGTKYQFLLSALNSFVDSDTKKKCWGRVKVFLLLFPNLFSPLFFSVSGGGENPNKRTTN